MDLTSDFIQLVKKNARAESHRRARSRPLPNEFLKAANSLSHEMTHLQQRLNQLYALYTVNVASSPYNLRTGDVLIDTLLANGIQPVDFTSIRADPAPGGMLQGLDSASASRIDDFVSAKLKDTATTVKGLEETVRAREQVLADARTIDLSRKKKQQALSLTTLLGMREVEETDSDEDEWTYSTGGRKPGTSEFPELDFSGKLVNSGSLSDNGKGSARFQAVVDGPTSQELTWRREILHIIEGYISAIAETMSKMRKVRNETVGARYVSENRLSSRKKLLPVRKPTKMSRAALLEDEHGGHRHAEHEYEEDDVRHVVRAGGDLTLLQMEASKQDQTRAEELQAALRAETTMSEINQMLGDFSMRVAQQAETVQSIHDNVFDTNINVVAGNSQLQKALDRGSTGAKIFVIYFLVLTVVLLVLDHYIS